MTEIITPQNQEKFSLLMTPSRDCTFPLSDGDHVIIAEMERLLENLGAEAAGLAACQIGYAKKIFALNFDGKIKFYINPHIISKSERKKKVKEACLSLPGQGFQIKRPLSVELEYTTVDGKNIREIFDNFWAQAVCHEMDHLDGKLISMNQEVPYSYRVPRTSFGMKLTPQKLKQIRKRRKKRKLVGR